MNFSSFYEFKKGQLPRQLGKRGNTVSFFKVLTLKKPVSKCGMYTYDDGSRYIGDFDENGIKNGKGHIEASNGATYEGQFQKGTFGPKPF